MAMTTTIGNVEMAAAWDGDEGEDWARDWERYDVAARATGDGTALGVDLSSRMIERARELAHVEGLTNARFEQADAQVYPFDAEVYDVVLSRFGTMFFAD